MATDIFSKEISIYNGATDTIGIVATLGTFLFSKRHIPEILRIRSIGDEKERKAIKKRLPQAAISGIFSKRNKEGLIQHSGLICIDIDGKDNPNSLASADQLGVLSRHIKRELLEMSRQLRQGSITADPFYRSPRENACAYCDFASACHFAERLNGEKNRYLTKLKTEEVWARMEEADRHG